MFIAIIPVIVMIIGLLMWTLSSNTRVAEIGRYMFAVGLLWTVYTTTGKTLRLG